MSLRAAAPVDDHVLQFAVEDLFILHVDDRDSAVLLASAADRRALVQMIHEARVAHLLRVTEVALTGTVVGLVAG